MGRPWSPKGRRSAPIWRMLFRTRGWRHRRTTGGAVRIIAGCSSPLGLFFAAGPLEAAATNQVLGFVAPAGRERMLGYGRYEDVIATLDSWLSAHDYIAGDSFTAAYLFVGSQIG